LPRPPTTSFGFRSCSPHEANERAFPSFASSQRNKCSKQTGTSTTRPNQAFFNSLLVLVCVGGVTLLTPTLRLQSRLVLPTGITFGFFGGILGGIAAMSGPLVFIFLLAKGLRGKAFTKEASLYLVISAGLMAILLTASREFGWLDVSVSTAAMLPVALGMYVGQHMRDKIAPETFKKLVLTAVIAAGAELVRHGFFG
jgi:uncharacterized protein